jgi:hypothetical protein
MRFEDKDDFVEIDLASQENAELRSQGDGCLRIRISSAGFTGHSNVWVLADSLRSFCRALLALERDRRGEATIESISPGELKLKIRSVDSLGHMTIEGSTGHSIQRRCVRTWHSVAFGLEFDPSQLVRAVAAEWVRKNV